MERYRYDDYANPSLVDEMFKRGMDNGQCQVVLTDKIPEQRKNSKGDAMLRRNIKAGNHQLLLTELGISPGSIKWTEVMPWGHAFKTLKNDSPVVFQKGGDID